MDLATQRDCCGINMSKISTVSSIDNKIRFRTSGRLLAILSGVLLLAILILGITMLNQIQSLRQNVQITDDIINANIRILGQVQRELLRLKIAIIDDSDNETIDLYRAFASQRINEVSLSYNEATLGSESLIERADILVLEWDADIEPLIQDVLLDETDDDSSIRNDLIARLTDLEIEYNSLSSSGENNRRNQAGTANDAAQLFVQNAQLILFGLGFTILGYIIFISLAAIDYIHFDRQREETNEHLRLQQSRLSSLLNIATQSQDLQSQFNEIVEQGTKSLAMQVGIISRIYADGYTVTSAYAPDHAITSGMSCDLDATLCKRTVQEESILSVPDIASIMQIKNPCFDAILPSSYIGTPLMVNGELYGTLSFVSEALREPTFSESDEDFVRIMGEWINVALERQQARDELASYTNSLEKSNTELQQFAYAASHDLQEPLRKIQTFGSRIEAKYSDVLDERGNQYLARMQNAAGRMQILIQDLLSLSRVTTQALPLEDTDLNIVMEGVLSDIEIQIEKSRAEITVETLPTIKADATQMRQLFQNLITNSLKFAREDVMPKINVSAITKVNTLAPKIEICFSDNGIGFDQQYAERIFSVFQRLHGRGEYEGTGVGLALCRKIVERHNGTIIANGNVNEGATFIITLPIDHI